VFSSVITFNRVSLFELPVTAGSAGVLHALSASLSGRVIMTKRPKMLFQILVLVSTCAAMLPAQAALDAYMRVVGAQQGAIEGGVTLAGQEGAFAINEIHHLTTSAEAGTVHQPLIVTTALGKGIPLLMQALDNGEILAIELRLYQPTQAGSEENFYTLELANARLVAAEPISPDNKNPELISYPARIRLRFEFEAISHTAVLAGEQVEL
jgi:type VI secretion system Hcp family effector